MNYEDLKDGEKVNVYIPTMKRFYRLEVTKRIEMFGGGYAISNLSCPRSQLIDGHEYLGLVKNQSDIDNFFYMQKQKVTDSSFEKAEEHFKKNRRSWIF